jgi:hypothetical protein
MDEEVQHSETDDKQAEEEEEEQLRRRPAQVKQVAKRTKGNHKGGQ